jgi:hypothetical protein
MATLGLTTPSHSQGKVAMQPAIEQGAAGGRALGAQQRAP